jgi:branched-subunit amino acid ABC-type transport system permease component
MAKFLQLTVNGLAEGSIIAISAVGLTLVYGILKIVNFAHGDYLTFGAYMALVANVAWHVPLFVAVLVAMLLTVVLAIFLEFSLWRPMRARSAGVTSLFLTSIGLALVLRHAILLVWGGGPRGYTAALDKSYDLGLFRISIDRIVVISVAFALIITVGLFLSRTRIGKAMRAVSDNKDLAAVSGIDPDRIVLYTWILAGALAGLAGVLLVIYQAALTPNSGWFLLLPIFAAVVLGGVGSAYGALAAGVVLGLVMEYSSYALPFTYKTAVAFGVMIAALLVRPQGLFGRARAV